MIGGTSQPIVIQTAPIQEYIHFFKFVCVCYCFFGGENGGKVNFVATRWFICIFIQLNNLFKQWEEKKNGEYYVLFCLLAILIWGWDDW